MYELSDRCLLQHPDRYVRYLEPPTQQIRDTSVVPTANRGYYTPFQVPYLCIIDGVIAYHRAVAAGNLRSALYQSVNESPTNRLAISVLTAVNGIQMKQHVPFTAPIQVVPGYYFGHFWVDAVDEYYCAFPFNAMNWPPTPISSLYQVGPCATPAGPPAIATPVQSNYNESAFMLLRVSLVIL